MLYICFSAMLVMTGLKQLGKQYWQDLLFLFFQFLRASNFTQFKSKCELESWKSVTSKALAA